jgi:GMP synthase-like glutamine amidotransferase
MKPVGIFRHSPTEGPGYFAIFLEAHQIPWRLIPIDAGAIVPKTADAFSGLCFMGGPMSVNDPLPWIEQVCALIRDAVQRNTPVLGHCLGGQLMSKALGGTVIRNPVKEIGWSTGTPEITSELSPETSPNSSAKVREWLDKLADRNHPLFQWHGETFSLPKGATRLLHTPDCTNQVFVLGPHLGMQCHVEMTPEMISRWCVQWADECESIVPIPSVQTPHQILSQIQNQLTPMRELADQLYGQWIQGLAKNG